MNKYIMISNDGEIDINAFMLIGASTKRDDPNMIGFFGSGLKYSIAVLLRNKINFRIFSGLREIKISSREQNFRDKVFNQIFINERETSMTHEMGIDWLAWFPIREIYCNSLDEKNGEIQVVQEILPAEDKTTFFIELCPAIEEILLNWNDYFSNRRTDVVMNCPELKVYAGDDKKYIIYRRGVQCHFSKGQSSVYHYDVRDIDINESRTLKHGCDATWRVAELVAKYATCEVIRGIMDHSKDKIESHFMWSQVGFYNENWIDVINGRFLVPEEMAGHYASQIIRGNCLILKSSLCRSLKNYFKTRVSVVGHSDNEGKFFVIEPDQKQSDIINDCKKFFEKAQLNLQYPIKVCVFEDKSILGQAIGKEIFLSVDVFEHGRKKVAETILEEYFHIITGLSDESRGFQDYLINKIVGNFEEKVGVYF